MLGIRRLKLPQPPTKKLVVELAWDNWVGRWMYNRGWAGLTTAVLPWLTIVCYWLLPGEAPDPECRFHEFQHVAQIERLGWLGWWWTYGREALRGYNSNALEREAYSLTAKAVRAGLPEWATATDSQ